MSVIVKIFSFFLALFSLFTSLVNGTYHREESTMDDFELVWSDEFDGDTLDTSKWSTRQETEIRRGGYWNGDLLEVKDGNLVIYSKYLENGVQEGDPAGWYTAQVSSRGLYEQTYGYFEVRCILPEGYGQWAAFWMNSPAMGNSTYIDSRKGAEIDIFESAYFGTDNPDKVTSAVHFGGYGSALTSISPIYTGGVQPVDPYHSFNTYGLEWNESEYIFYINGEVYARTNRFQVMPSQTPEYLILSVEMSGSDGIPYNSSDSTWAPGTMEDNGRDFVSEFVIDYVRCYQYK